MRKLAAFTVSFALGICLAQYLLPERLLLPVAAVFFAAACLALLLPGLWRKRVLLVGTGLALALGWNWLYSYAVRAPLAALSGSEGTASMTLLEYAVPTDYGAKVTVKLEGVPLGKVVCYGGADLLDLEPGQTVAAQVKFQDSARLREDTITNFTAQGVFLLAYQRGDEAVYGEGSAGSPRWWPAHAARAMQNRVTALFDGDEAAFLSAILTGDTSGLSEEARSDLSEAGLSHILSVSGLHCGFLMTLILLLTGRHRHRLAAALALPGLLQIFYPPGGEILLRRLPIPMLHARSPLFTCCNGPRRVIFPPAFPGRTPHCAKTDPLQAGSAPPAHGRSWPGSRGPGPGPTGLPLPHTESLPGCAPCCTDIHPL